MKEVSIQVGEMLVMQRLKVQFKSPLNELVLVKNVILYFKWLFMQIQLTTAEMTMDTATKAADVIQIVNKTEELVCFILKCSYLCVHPSNVHNQYKEQSIQFRAAKLDKLYL